MDEVVLSCTLILQHKPGIADNIAEAENGGCLVELMVEKTLCAYWSSLSRRELGLS